MTAVEPINRASALELVERIRRLRARPATFMEVCGTHTVAVFRAGIRNTLLPERGISLVSGPGCPVCVTAAAEIDDLAEFALQERERITVTSYGDLLRATGHRSSLAAARAQGADIRIVTSAYDNLRLAQEHTERQIVFFGIGFETTQPGLAHTILTAERLGLENFTVYLSHKVIPPALRLLASEPRLRLDGFILPGHVSTIIGEEPYRFLAEEHGLPGVIAGFQPEDILAALYYLLRMREAGTPRILNAYSRAVKPGGNQQAKALLKEVFAPADAHWRGIGTLPASGHVLRERFAAFDAHLRFGLRRVRKDTAGFGSCRCSEVLLGLISPPQCELFGDVCTPDSPVGACMVSSEGACANYHRFGGLR